MKIIGVIPARWASTRFQGKVLAEIHGKPMLQHVWERAQQSRHLNDLLIACDDEKVLKTAKQFKAKAVLTSKDHPSGTDRIAEAVQNLQADIIVNIQADEPLIHPSMIDDLAQALMEDSSCGMATVIKRIDNEKDLNNPNVVKVVIDQKGYALYFSRLAIPYNRENKNFLGIEYYKHLGIYAYRKDFLFTFKNLPKSKLEEVEQLEQLRALEAGYKIKTVKTDRDTIGVDTPEDLKKVEALWPKQLK